MGWATYWAALSPTHLVTLVRSPRADNLPASPWLRSTLSGSTSVARPILTRASSNRFPLVNCGKRLHSGKSVLQQITVLYSTLMKLFISNAEIFRDVVGAAG
jgi:hypothetical protein